MILALFGLSCTGKTAIARQLAADRGLDLRSCGQELKKIADREGLTPGKLSPDIYNRVDLETIGFAISHRTCPTVIEGRYLDLVLEKLDLPLVLIEIRASYEERCRRRSIRFGNDLVYGTLRDVDDADAKLRAQIYSTSSGLTPSAILDTTSIAIAECARQVANLAGLRN